MCLYRHSPAWLGQALCRNRSHFPCGDGIVPRNCGPWAYQHVFSRHNSPRCHFIQIWLRGFSFVSRVARARGVASTTDALSAWSGDAGGVLGGVSSCCRRSWFVISSRRMISSFSLLACCSCSLACCSCRMNSICSAVGHGAYSSMLVCMAVVVIVIGVGVGVGVGAGMARAWKVLIGMNSPFTSKSTLLGS